MPTYHASIQNLRYDENTRTFYATQSELKKLGILYGLKKTDSLVINGIKAAVKFEYYFDIDISTISTLVYAPRDSNYLLYRLLVDDK